MDLKHAESTAEFLAENGGDQLIVNLGSENYQVYSARSFEGKAIDPSKIVRRVQSKMAEAMPKNVQAAAPTPKGAAKKDTEGKGGVVTPAPRPDMVSGLIPKELHDFLAEHGWTMADAITGFRTIYYVYDNKTAGSGLSQCQKFIEAGRQKPAEDGGESP